MGVGNIGRAWDHRKEGEGGNHGRGEGYKKGGGIIERARGDHKMVGF